MRVIRKPFEGSVLELIANLFIYAMVGFWILVGLGIVAHLLGIIELPDLPAGKIPYEPPTFYTPPPLPVPPVFPGPYR